MKFVDKVKIFVKSGKGGNGAVSFRREKYIPNGGPDGGDGGNGGSIIFTVDSDLDTLFDFVCKVHFEAKDGEKGGSSNCTGKSGDNLNIKVPLGTQIYDESLEHLIFDFTNNDDQFILLPGGKGGKGNSRFVTSVNQAPKTATEGEPSEEMWIYLILKFFCDFGLVGLPNAGKSSLLRILTNAHAKVADYPFTTLTPKLGALFNNTKKLILADLPGIIKNAHKNKGLGYRFLGHIERCKGIVFVIDISLGNALETFEILLNELKEFFDKEAQSNLFEKQHIVLLNKIDLVDEKFIAKEIKLIKRRYDLLIFPVTTLDNNSLISFVEHLVQA